MLSSHSSVLSTHCSILVSLSVSLCLCGEQYSLTPKDQFAPVLRFHLQLEDRVVHNARVLVAPVRAQARALAGLIAVSDAEIAAQRKLRRGFQVEGGQWDSGSSTTRVARTPSAC